MEQDVCMPKINSILDIFSEALINKEVKVIELLLSDLGEFEIQSPKLNTLQVNKKTFCILVYQENNSKRKFDNYN